MRAQDKKTGSHSTQHDACRAAKAPPQIAAIQLYRARVSSTSLVVSFSTPSGFRHSRDLAATSACTERYATICKPRRRKSAREEILNDIIAEAMELCAKTIETTGKTLRDKVS